MVKDFLVRGRYRCVGFVLRPLDPDALGLCCLSAIQHGQCSNGLVLTLYALVDDTHGNRLALLDRPGDRVGGLARQVDAEQVLSSAGLVETMRMCDETPAHMPPAGQLSFVETASVLDVEPRDLGCDRTIVFYNDSPSFHWKKPDELIDTRSGVICCPNNFAYDEPLGEGVVRVTALANFDQWKSLPADLYQATKQRCYDEVLAKAVRFVPDFRSRVVASDTFTPTTIKRYTGHDNGAVYGAPDKRPSGTTHLKNLFICGTDQGLVGIIGAMVSGIMMANKHLLRTPAEQGVEQVAAAGLEI